MPIKIIRKDNSYYELGNLENTDKFMKNEILPLLKIPKGYRAIYNGNSHKIGIEKDGTFYWTKKPLFPKEYAGEIVTMYIDNLVSEANNEISEVGNFLKEIS